VAGSLQPEIIFMGHVLLPVHLPIFVIFATVGSSAGLSHLWLLRLLRA
jgi:hypothetical protein